MANVLCSRARLVVYLPGLQTLVRNMAGVRVISAAAPPSDQGLDHILCSSDGNQLPDGVGCDYHLEPAADQDWSAQQMMSVMSNSETRFHHPHSIPEFYDINDTVSCQKVSRAGYFDNSRVECSIQSCPELLKQDVRSMFPEAPDCDMTVVTVTQKTENDMTAWSVAVEQERDQMLASFVEGAKQMCLTLQQRGFWADFIEPASGLAFFGSYTNNTLFETDERFRHLGFEIEDLGCCRVIRHSRWGTHVFVGTIFTSAPPSSVVMRTVAGS